MIETIAFEDEIRVYFDRVRTLAKGECYQLLSGGKEIARSEKTHFTYKGLTPETAYSLAVYLLSHEGRTLVGEAKVKTMARPRRLSVLDFGAVGDGKTLNTKALQSALDAAGEGDCVYIPEGVFLTGGLFVHSNTYIYIEKGGVLQGTADFRDYLPKVKSRFEGIEQMCYQSLLNLGTLDHASGYNCENVILRGEGKISGGGAALCDGIIAEEMVQMKDYMDSLGESIKECETAWTIPGRARGRLIQMANCRRVILSGLYLSNGPSWNVHFIYSKEIITCGCYIHSTAVHNGDGWDPDSSEDCVLFDTRFETGDDCVAIKSGKNPEGNIIARPTKNIRVFDCSAVCGHSIAIGSEMSGGVENVAIWDCDMKNAAWGIHIKSAEKRGGYIKNVRVYDTDAAMVRIVGTVGYNNDGIGAPTYAHLSDFHFENMTLAGESFVVQWDTGERKKTEINAIYVEGLDKEGCEIARVTFKNIRLPRLSDGAMQQIMVKKAKDVALIDVYAE